MAHISSAISQSSSGSREVEGAKWATVIRTKINEVIQRRAEQGDSLDASDVVDEVLPMAIATIPIEVRKQLFQKVRKMVTPNTTN